MDKFCAICCGALVIMGICLILVCLAAAFELICEGIEDLRSRK